MRFTQRAQEGCLLSKCALLQHTEGVNAVVGVSLVEHIPTSPPFTLPFHVTAGPNVEQMYKTSINCW